MSGTENQHGPRVEIGTIGSGGSEPQGVRDLRAARSGLLPVVMTVSGGGNQDEWLRRRSRPGGPATVLQARVPTDATDYILHRVGAQRLYLNRAETTEVVKALSEWLATPATATTGEGDQSR